MYEDKKAISGSMSGLLCRSSFPIGRLPEPQAEGIGRVAKSVPGCAGLYGEAGIGAASRRSYFGFTGVLHQRKCVVVALLQ